MNLASREEAMTRRHHFFACVILVMFVAALPQGASADGDVFYLADSAATGGPQPTTYLYAVHVDPVLKQNESPEGVAELELLGMIPYEQVDALACTPDGARCWAFDKYVPGHPLLGAGGRMGYFDISTRTFVDSGMYLMHAGEVLRGVVLAAFAPDGVCYVASQWTDLVYTVDLTTGEATPVGTVMSGGGVVDLMGADIAFTAAGTFYLWSNFNRGLYRATMPAAAGPIAATELGTNLTAHYLTGLAVRANGHGDLIGSIASSVPDFPDHFHNIPLHLSPLAADALHPCYAMVEYIPGPSWGLSYDYSYGDMSSGPLELCTGTIGYYKNHPWDGQVVALCGGAVVLDETEGKRVLWSASNRNFSMLIAQLIAAKLNVGGAPGVGEIDAAEAWLCAAENVPDFSSEWWWATEFADRAQRAEATELKTALDDFNNSNVCDEDANDWEVLDRFLVGSRSDR